MEEEDFIQQVAEAIESCMDVDSVLLRDDARFAWVVLPSGEKFCIAVIKHDPDAEDDEEEAVADEEPEGMFSDDDGDDD